MPVDPTASTGSRSTGAASNRVRFAGSVSCFTSIAIDRAHTSRSSPRRWRDHASDRSEVYRLQANDVTWPGVACVCMSMKTGHAQRLNMLKERPRKWFFREEVDFLASLAFVVNCGHTIDLQQVQAKRFSFITAILIPKFSRYVHFSFPWPIYQRVINRRCRWKSLFVF